jgi:hypothetical protein
VKRLSGFFLRPFQDAFHGLDHCLGGGMPALLRVALGLAVGWWVYVPLHELLHALACMATGGTVQELEISPLYGGGLLAAWIPWVTAGGEYAGRLTGFDTGGSDLVYLATDFGPFLLTLLPGVWWLRRAARAASPLAFGASVPFALAPFTSITGDAYEIGSILVTRMPPWFQVGWKDLLRGDDVLLKVEELSSAGAGASVWAGLVVAVTLGLAWAFVTYGLGGGIARLLGQPPLEAPEASSDAPTTAPAEDAPGKPEEKG